MKAVRVTEEWQRAGVHYVRTQAMCLGFKIPLEGEFSDDTPEDEYILVMDGIYPVFRLNKKLLRDYPNLWAYARDLYQTPGFGDTTNFAAIKKHYHIDCCPSNEFAIVPNGPYESLWLTPHGREKLSAK